MENEKLEKTKKRILRGDAMSNDDLIREYVSTAEEYVKQIQIDIDKLNKERERVRQKRILLGKKQYLLEEK